MKKQAYPRAFEQIDQATLASRQRDDGGIDENLQYRRYMAVRNDPARLYRFVAESLGTKNPDQIRRGAAEYLTDMEERYAQPRK